MLLRPLYGLLGGGTFGLLYGHFFRCSGVVCSNSRSLLVPVAFCAAMGLFVAMSSRR